MTFTSSSTVRFFLEAGDDGGAVDPDGVDRTGDQRDAARARESPTWRPTHDVDGLVAALVEDAARG